MALVTVTSNAEKVATLQLAKKDLRDSIAKLRAVEVLEHRSLTNQHEDVGEIETLVGNLREVAEELADRAIATLGEIDWIYRWIVTPLGEGYSFTHANESSANDRFEPKPDPVEPYTMFQALDIVTVTNTGTNDHDYKVLSVSSPSGDLNFDASYQAVTGDTDDADITVTLKQRDVT